MGGEGGQRQDGRHHCQRHQRPEIVVDLPCCLCVSHLHRSFLQFVFGCYSGILSTSGPYLLPRASFLRELVYFSHSLLMLPSLSDGPTRLALLGLRELRRRNPPPLWGTSPEPRRPGI